MTKRQILPYPTSQKERTAAKQAHIKAVEAGKPIPHFKDSSNKLHYFDNKGSGRLQLNNLGTKLRNEANRKAAKKNLTPSELDYIDVYGNDKGRQLYKAEQAKLKKIYSVTPSATHDVDHINSQADGGVHHSRNLRAQNKSRNRSEGQRGLNTNLKTSLLVGNTPKEHISLQGPQVTPRQRQALLRGASNVFEVGGGVVKRLAKTAVPAAAGGVLLSAAELGQRAQAAQRNPSALNLLQTGISAVETAADGVAIGGYTSGVGAPLGLVADGVSFAAGITNGGIDAVRQLSGAN